MERGRIAGWVRAMAFVFVAEPRLDSLDRTIRGWQIVHYVDEDRFVGPERFCTEAAARAWASRLNRMAEPLPGRPCAG